jgi:hypothetical protein
MGRTAWPGAALSRAAWRWEDTAMMKTYWMGLGCLVLLAGCGAGSSQEEAQAKDAAADSKAGSPPIADGGKWVGSEAAVVADSAGGSDSRRDDLVSPGETGGQAREDAPTSSRLDAFPDSPVADAFRESLGQDGPKADGVLPVDLIVDTRAADLAPAAEAGPIKTDSAADRPDTSSSPPSFPCDHDSDCCIEIDNCMNVAYMYSTARGASPKPEIPPSTGMCTPCIPAAVQVRCVAHQCVGERIQSTYGGPLLSGHCGPVNLPDAGTTPHHDLPTDAGATPPKSVWTCGESS